MLAEKGQQGFMDTSAQNLGWNGASGSKSIAGIPDKLNKGFMDMYVAAPLLTA